MDYQPQPSATEDLFQVAPPIYGSFWERFGAAFLDGLILAIPNIFLQFMSDELSQSIGTIVVYWLYFALQESSAVQATIGKKALGLKVTNLNGEQISFMQATGRHFGKYISALIILIGYLMMLWDDKKQTLHDKMAGTLVVKR